MIMTPKDFDKVVRKLKENANDIASLHVEMHDGQIESYFVGDIHDLIDIIASQIASNADIYGIKKMNLIHMIIDRLISQDEYKSRNFMIKKVKEID